MSILVTGGAGFIGSVVVDQLRSKGNTVVVVDDLSRGFRDAIDADVAFYQASIGDTALISTVVADHDVDACVHLAGLIAVGESVQQPTMYWQRNVVESIRLFETLTNAGVEHVVFSSSAAVYGDPHEVPIDENHAMSPTSSYGNTKLAIEMFLRDLSRATPLQSVCLRYFNAAGATDRRRERHNPETHLIPLALRAAKEMSALQIFGTDYPTPDGTAVRDYIHVEDLVSAHLLAIDYLRDRGSTISLNLGIGQGASVQEVIAATERVTGMDVAATDAARRDGDPAVLVASADLARNVLQWRPHRTDLDDIISSAWHWESQNHQ